MSSLKSLRKFNLAALLATSKPDLLYLAQIAQKAKRYDEMVQLMNVVVAIGHELTGEERDLLSFAYRNVLQVRIYSWRVVRYAQTMTDDSERQKRIVRKYKDDIEQEITELCNEVMDLLDRYLIPTASTPESQTFYPKMKGDYFRYLSKIAAAELKPTFIEESYKAYKNAFEIAKEKLPSTHPLTLAVAVNYSISFRHISSRSDRAGQLAKQSFEETVTELNKIFKDCGTTILQLIRDKKERRTQNDKQQEGGDN